MPPGDDRASHRSPLETRYASAEMVALWSERARIRAFRDVWLALAEGQRALGLPVSAEQVAELRAHLDDIDFEAADAEERRRRHDVMAHVHAYGLVAPLAKPIIHLGATSCDVTDNADLIIQRRALRLLEARAARVVEALGAFARRHRALACLGATHLQPAQPTTVGKRACLWAQDFVDDLDALGAAHDGLALRGLKGTTGTQASYLQLLDGDHARVQDLERRVAATLGFARVAAVTGQTYPRKWDVALLGVVAGLASSAGKLAADVRLLQAFGELAEPFGAEQTGSSAMPYKRNPMRSERLTSLARFLASLPANAAETAMSQWLERTLDDSANRRLVIAQAFLAADAILLLAADIAQGLQVHPKVIARRLSEELPFLASEVLLAEGVKAGGDRQDLHEAIRRHSHEAARRVKEDGAGNDLFERLAGDPAFGKLKSLLPTLTDPARFIGRAPEQVDDFLSGVLEPALAHHRTREAARPEAGRPDLGASSGVRV